MTTMQIDRAVVEQALEALSLALSDVNWRADSPTQPVIHKAHAALRAALAQEQDPEPVPHQHEWFRAGGWEPGRIRCIHCGKWGKETFDE